MEEMSPYDLKFIRLNHKWKQHEVASALGVSLRQYQAYEYGDSEIKGPVARLVILLDADVVSLHDLQNMFDNSSD
jgi:transcriptional regulator with XRE-family HTH domain